MKRAFPQKYPIDAGKPHHWDDNPVDRGMDLRDYFAIHFAQSQINLIKDEQFDALETFKTSYKLADIMMKAREN
jgi:hypothetical protein